MQFLLFFSTVLLVAACVDTRPPKITKLSDGPISIPARKGQMNDYVGIIDTKTAESLESRLNDVRTKTRIDIVIVIVPTTDGHRLEEHSMEIAKHWELNPASGKRSTLLLDIAVHDHEMRVQVTEPLWEIFPNEELERYQTKLQQFFEADQFAAGLSHFVDDVLERLAVQQSH